MGKAIKSKENYYLYKFITYPSIICDINLIFEIQYTSHISIIWLSILKNIKLLQYKTLRINNNTIVDSLFIMKSHTNPFLLI